ncbi:hypothetical protein ACJX0J_033737 [Zea mays]
MNFIPIEYPKSLLLIKESKIQQVWLTSCVNSQYLGSDNPSYVKKQEDAAQAIHQSIFSFMYKEEIRSIGKLTCTSRATRLALFIEFITFVFISLFCAFFRIFASLGADCFNTFSCFVLSSGSLLFYEQIF